ncbi:hypothetical protein EDC04DRAFT_2605804 [Pisolithus marmoratus]|nr:hypothetical protein EDC04DRAFT_2605804 [Pisolithus marmoratus]
MDGGAEKLRMIDDIENNREGPGYQEGWNTEVAGHARWAVGEMDGGALEGVMEQQCLNESGGESICRWRGVNFSFTMATGSKACFYSLCSKTKANINGQHVIVLGK